jgi:hypothetical protein
MYDKGQAMYDLIKDGRMWIVVTTHGRIPQYRSTNRRFCLDWINDNSDISE